MTTWYILSPIDQLCSSCPVPHRCNENNPRCLRRQALAAGNVPQRKPTPREIQLLDYLKRHPDDWFRGVDLANAIGASTRTTLNLLARLAAKDKISHVGKGHTSRWTAKLSP